MTLFNLLEHVERANKNPSFHGKKLLFMTDDGELHQFSSVQAIEEGVAIALESYEPEEEEEEEEEEILDRDDAPNV